MRASVDDAARALIEERGSGAAYAALERLNQSIDQRDWFGRDFWAQVVRAIHEYQQIVPPQSPALRNPRQTPQPAKIRNNQPV